MESTDNLFKYTFLFEHDDGTDTTVHKARSMMLEDVLTDFAAFLHDDRVGYVNDITFIIHDGARGDLRFLCQAKPITG
jgi:hypothetical protein